MFELDPGKLLLLGVVILLFIKPEDLPRVLRTMGQVMGKLRRTAGLFQSQIQEALRESEVQETFKAPDPLMPTPPPSPPISPPSSPPPSHP